MKLKRFITISSAAIIALGALSITLGCASAPAENITEPWSEVPKQQFMQLNPGNTMTSTSPISDNGTLSLRGMEGTLVFMSGTDDVGGAQLYTSNVDGTNFKRLTKNKTGAEYFPRWSSDGTNVLFFLYVDENQKICVINEDGSNQMELTDETSDNWIPCWSPDDKKIAFVSNRDNTEQIYIMNADGSDQTNISNTIYSDSNPSWSPDGSKILFNSNRDGNVQIYVMNADGSDQVNLSNNEYHDFFPVWSPDGQKIVFQSSPEMDFFQIYVIDADGSGRVQLTNITADNKYPAWSPDGSMIVFYSKRDCPNDNGEIYIMNADGSNQIRVTRTGCTDTGIASWK
ncbi:MAG: PD40 domain-containing protein [Dehalococcoidia bacterium]|nr:PD40 domain-containing protein [Dehalococcoidia bacterium]